MKELLEVLGVVAIGAWLVMGIIQVSNYCSDKTARIEALERYNERHPRENWVQVGPGVWEKK